MASTSSGPLNYTTTIPAEKTIGECQAILAKAGAISVAIHYAAGSPAGLSFALSTPHGRRSFTLPVNVDGMHEVLKKAYKDGEIRSHAARSSILSYDQAVRVAWRVTRNWLDAQLAVVAANMATIDQVMLPYLHVDGDRTLYEAYREHEQAALPVGEGS